MSNFKLKSSSRIAIISTYHPRKCGIATFTYDLHNALRSVNSDNQYLVIPVTDEEEAYNYGPEARFEILEKDINSYHQTADFLNFNDIDTVLFQHEYGIFGGDNGINVLELMRDLHMPVITTLHTVLKDPDDKRRRILKEISNYSDRLVVISEKGKEFLQSGYNIPDNKIIFIPHGVHDVPFTDPSFYKDQFGVAGKKVILTFGLLSPGKGIENVIKALPEIVKIHPDTVYIILGKTHPNEVRYQGEFYRLSLERMAKELNVEEHIIFYNRFVDLEELKQFIAIADIYITPYRGEEQISSGTLAYTLGAGKAIISTPYWYAKELLSDERGILIPFNSPESISEKVLWLLDNDIEFQKIRKNAYLYGRKMIWPKVAIKYLELFSEVKDSVKPGKRILKPLVKKPRGRPILNISYLLRLSTDIGIFQHAIYTVPNYNEGYTTDDNARALIVSVLLEKIGQDVEIDPIILITRYLAFLNFAWNEKEERFRNFLYFNHQWKENVGSEDCHGRAIWALGKTISTSKKSTITGMASYLFEKALPSVQKFESIRGWSYSLLGIYEYLQRFSGDRTAGKIQEDLSFRLVKNFKKCSGKGWHWFEDILTYCNALIPCSLFLCGHMMNNKEMMDIALKALRWLNKIQTSESGYFRPIGSNGFYRKGEEKAMFDQQPVEAFSSVYANLKFFELTGKKEFKDEAQRDFDWFFGSNDLQETLYNSAIGGCRDGLHSDRVNLNHGAESTLSFLMSLLEMRLTDVQIPTNHKNNVPVKEKL